MCSLYLSLIDKAGVHLKRVRRLAGTAGGSLVHVVAGLLEYSSALQPGMASRSLADFAVAISAPLHAARKCPQWSRRFPACVA